MTQEKKPLIERLPGFIILGVLGVVLLAAIMSKLGGVLFSRAEPQPTPAPAETPLPVIARNTPAQIETPTPVITSETTPAPATSPNEPATPTPTASIDPEKAREMGRQLRSDIASFISSEEQKYRAVEDKERRRIAYGDVNGDGLEDVIILYDLTLLKEDDYKLAAVLNDGNRYSDWLTVDLGYQPNMEASGQGIIPEGVSVEQSEIVIKGKTYARNAITPTIPATYYYTVSNGKLKRITSHSL